MRCTFARILKYIIWLSRICTGNNMNWGGGGVNKQQINQKQASIRPYYLQYFNVKNMIIQASKYT